MRLKLLPMIICTNMKASTDNIGVKEYQVLRNGEVIDTVPGTTFIDKN